MTGELWPYKESLRDFKLDSEVSGFVLEDSEGHGVVFAGTGTGAGTQAGPQAGAGSCAMTSTSNSSRCTRRAWAVVAEDVTEVKGQ